jgi:hypothetical protein
MASTYSPLKIELIGTGEQAGTWSVTTNTNLGTTIEQAITGSGNVTFAGSDVTLTLVNSNAAQTARNLRLVCVGSSAGPRQLIVPSIKKQYIVKNELADTVTIKNVAGTGIAVPSGKTMVVFNDSVNVVDVTTHVTSLTVAGNLTVSGTLNAPSPALTGTPTAPTATPGTNTTQIATTAFVTNAVTTATGNLGTMSTQNANNVSITGGTITNITALAVADGGTGRSAITLNNLVLGNGTNPVQTLAPGTAGNVLVSNGTTWVASQVGVSGIKLGLGITGEVWNNLTGSKAFNTTYTNSRSYPIFVSASTNYMGGSQQLLGYVNGVLVCFWKWQFNGAGAVGGVAMIVPPGATYSCNTDGGVAVQNWQELY